MQGNEIFRGSQPRKEEKKVAWSKKISFESILLVSLLCHQIVNMFSSFFSILDAVNCCAVMSTNMVAFLLLNNHRKVCCLHSCCIESSEVLQLSDILVYFVKYSSFRVQRLKNCAHRLNGCMEKSLPVEGKVICWNQENARSNLWSKFISIYLFLFDCFLIIFIDLFLFSFFF